VKERHLIYVSLIFSVAAVIYASWIQMNATAFAKKALRDREADIVRHYAPKVRNVYRDISSTTNTFPQNPETIEELLDPLFQIVDQLDHQPPGQSTNSSSQN
jgi:hypothetical protein